RFEGRLATKRTEIGTDEAMRDPGELFELDIVGQRHSARVDVQDLEASVSVRDADDQLPVKATGASERLVDGVRSIRRPDHDQVLSGLESVHQGEKLGHQASLAFTDALASLGCDRIDLVDEDDRRIVLF